MLGPHQAENAASAVRAAELTLGDRLVEDMVPRALRGARNPGRFEVFEGKPLVILDARTVPAFLGLFDGKNTGKMLVKLAGD